MSLGRLVAFVEGHGDRTAVPRLAARLVKEAGGDDVVFVDSEPFRVGGLGRLAKNDGQEWIRFLRAAATTRKNLSGVLLVLDGDSANVPPSWRAYIERYKTSEFCARRVAAVLAEQARAVRAGDAFSLAAVFAMREFEAWLVAGIETLRGVELSEKRGVVPHTARAPDIDIEAKRDAKGMLRGQLKQYQETLDQGQLVSHVGLAAIRERCRSFRRLESALRQLIDAARSGNAVTTPLL